MLAQVTYRSNSKPFGDVLSHDQRVSVVEAEIVGHADALFTESITHGGRRHPALHLQYLFADGAGVLRVHRDVPMEQRLPDDHRSAKPLAMLRLNAVVQKQLLRDLAQDV